MLRAAVSSFCAITRPTRRESAQLDDLAGPLLNSVSDDTLRFVAASLSETPHAPPVLVRRLADQPTDISAPLLLRSPVLGNIDLLALIGRHGAGHARVIAARHQVDERIVRLISSLGVEAHVQRETKEPHEFGQDASQALPAVPPDTAAAAEATRERLRAVMRPSWIAVETGHTAEVRLRWDGDPGAYRKLRSTALTGVPTLFHTALADALDVDLARARAIAVATDMSKLIVAVRALHLSEEQAFLIVQCIWPARLAHVRAISAFFDAYDAVTPAQAVAVIEGWRNDGNPDPTDRVAANKQSSAGRLKAS